MPYQGYKKEDEENKENPIAALTDPETGGARSDVPFKDQPGVNQNANSHLRNGYRDIERGEYEKARDEGAAYVNQLQSLIRDRNRNNLRDMGLSGAQYESQKFQKKAQKAAYNDELMRAIRGGYNRDNMPVRQKNIEQGGQGVEKWPFDGGDQGVVGGEAPWSPINYAYEQTPSGGYNQFSYSDDFGNPFNAQQYPYVAQNLENPLSTLPEYIANYIVPGMDHFPTQEELEQLYDTSIW